MSAMDSKEIASWTNGTIDDAITYAILAQTEKSRFANQKSIAPPIRANLNEVVSDLRRLGAWFSPRDRIFNRDYDFVNDKVFKEANWSDIPDIEGDRYIKTVFRNIHTKTAKNMPKEWVIHEKVKEKPLFIFKNTELILTDECKILAISGYGGLSRQGFLIPTGFIQHANQKRFFGQREALVRCLGSNYLTSSFQSSVAMQSRNEMGRFWHVESVANNYKVVCGVYEEQVKSLFYARELPVTASGRKSPILHWVNAHRRRIKEGVDVEIKKHLRGVNSFEMNGVFFNITNPLKVGKETL